MRRPLYFFLRLNKLFPESPRMIHFKDGKSICENKPEEQESFDPVDIAKMDPKVDEIDLECSDIQDLIDEDRSTPAFNAYGTKYFVHISTQQKPAADEGTGSTEADIGSTRRRKRSATLNTEDFSFVSKPFCIKPEFHAILRIIEPNKESNISFK